MDYTEPLMLVLIIVCLFDVFAYYRYKYSQDVLEHLEKKRSNEKLKKIISTTEKSSEKKAEEKKVEEKILELKPPPEQTDASPEEGVTFYAEDNELPANQQ